MIPTGSTISDVAIETIEQPSLTWKLDTTKNRIVGMTDGLEAVKQAVYLVLQTERFAYLIFSSDYGQEFKELIGKSPSYVQSEMKRMVEEALLQDDRIKSIENMKTTVTGSGIHAEFTVVSIYGSFDVSQEVS